MTERGRQRVPAGGARPVGAAAPGRLQAWLERQARPIDGAGLAVFRIAFGLMMSAGVIRFMANGWVERFYGEPEMWFRYWGLSWLPVPSVEWLYALFTVLAIAALGIAFGALYRLSAAVFFVGFSYAQLLDVTNYLNHYYLVCLLALILVFAPLARTWSVDAWWRSRTAGRGRARGRRPSAGDAAALSSAADDAAGTVPTWAWSLLRFQVGVVYIFAGVAKLEVDWLLHAQPLNIWFTARTELPIIGPLLAWPETAYVASWGVLLFELAVVPLLLWRRSRPYIYAVIIGFHAMTHVFFDIGMFPFIMVVAATVFFDPSWPRRLPWPHRLRAALARPASSPRQTPIAPPPAWPALARGWSARLALAAVALYCAAQVLVPLRHVLYDGGVTWNEEGMRWSWKVMLREKHGSVTFFVKPSGATGTWQVSPRAYLDARQAREMAGQPDLILKLAHHIADDFRARGHGDVAVFAEALVSLNGRPAAPMIDPSVDLAKVRDGLAPKPWILPQPDHPPIQLHARRMR